MPNSKEKDFHHPYTPYDIQKEFMVAVYDTIEDGCVGILESPTGTGKSLSLICGSLTWLREHKKGALEDQLKDEKEDDNEPEWVRQHARQEKREKILRERTELEARLNAIREKERREKVMAEGNGRPSVKRRKREPEVEVEDDNDAQFILDDYESDSESAATKASAAGDGLSAETKELMKKLGMLVPGEPMKEDEELELPDETKFVHELRRVKMPSSLSEGGGDLEELIKHISLGSRKNLCINPNVAKLRNATSINERCLELQKPGTAQERRCDFLPTKDDQTVTRDFRDHALAQIRDIEDTANLGKKMAVCPYYASRTVIKPSEIVTLPYPLLLQKSAREALDISVKGHVVIIDEAHNLMDTISSIHSVSVTLTQLQRAKAQLDIYLGKFKNKLKGKNRVYVQQTVGLIDALAVNLEKLGHRGAEGEVQPSDALGVKGSVDQVNFHKVTRYLSESKLARKVEGYVAHTEHLKEQKEKGNKLSNKKLAESVPVLTHIQGFLMALTNPAAEGKIFYARTEAKELCYKYMLLDPTFHFKEIVEEARAVILAGGTMQPVEDYFTHLFPYLPREKIRTLSCGHVIPKENLLALPVNKGPTGRDFEFTFEKRKDPAMIDELGAAVGNLCITIPHGVVCFFPSYAYLDSAIAQWKKKKIGAGPSIWEKLSLRKQLFCEPREGSNVEETLMEYGQAIDQGKGGLLLSVVGGKMSEGINFNDNLGRGIIMVGLPFPNMYSAEWRAKLQHVENVADTASALSSPVPNDIPKNETERKARAKAAGREYYTNACMRAVNQSIGRAIRHREDYAAIVLLDRRFSSETIQQKLPGWIKSAIVAGAGGKFVDVMKNLNTFFRTKSG